MLFLLLEHLFSIFAICHVIRDPMSSRLDIIQAFIVKAFYFFDDKIIQRTFGAAALLLVRHRYTLSAFSCKRLM